MVGKDDIPWAWEVQQYNAEITCLYGAESLEIFEGRQRNRGRVD